MASSMEMGGMEKSFFLTTVSFPFGTTCRAQKYNSEY
jgi:hypothetical protein